MANVTGEYNVVEYVAQDNCGGDRASAWGLVIVVPVIFIGALTGTVAAVIADVSWVAIGLFALATLWMGSELYHMVIGYVANITQDLSIKFHWSVRWRAHLYKKKACADYFIEYDKWRLDNGGKPFV